MDEKLFHVKALSAIILFGLLTMRILNLYWLKYVVMGFANVFFAASVTNCTDEKMDKKKRGKFQKTYPYLVLLL